jgi:hypothetical protein
MTHNLPFARNPAFTSREAELERLGERLQKSGKVAVTLLNRDPVSGFHPRRDECVACDDRAVTFPPKQYMTGCMPRRVQPTPPWHSRHTAVIGQHLEPDSCHLLKTHRRASKRERGGVCTV